MKALEFQTKIQNGVIQVPADILENEDQEVKVILLWEEKMPVGHAREKIENIFKRLAQHKVFGDIGDPIEWQKSMRDEW